MASFSTFFHEVFFTRSPHKAVIEKDIERWMERLRAEKGGQAAHGSTRREQLALLLREYVAFRNLFYYRIGAYDKPYSRLMLSFAKTLCKPLDSLLISVQVIGPGLFIQHGYATVIGAVTIGENCWINQQVTLGMKNNGLPTLGNHVRVAPGAKILGGITIGDHVDVGANAVVLKDVPSNCTVAGVPAMIIKRDGVRVKEPLV